MGSRNIDISSMEKEKRKLGRYMKYASGQKKVYLRIYNYFDTSTSQNDSICIDKYNLNRVAN